MRLFIACAIACFAVSGVRADVVPSPPADPIAEACKPLLGVWQRTTPKTARNYKSFRFLAVDMIGASTFQWDDQANGVVIEASTARYEIDCSPAANGALTLQFKGSEGYPPDWSMDVTLSGDSFTHTEQSTYDRAGAPDPDWKPETYTVTYKRIVP